MSILRAAVVFLFWWATMLSTISVSMALPKTFSSAPCDDTNRTKLHRGTSLIGPLSCHPRWQGGILGQVGADRINAVQQILRGRHWRSQEVTDAQQKIFILSPPTEIPGIIFNSSLSSRKVPQKGGTCTQLKAYDTVLVVNSEWKWLPTKGNRFIVFGRWKGTNHKGEQTEDTTLHHAALDPHVTGPEIPGLGKETRVIAAELNTIFVFLAAASLWVEQVHVAVEKNISIVLKFYQS